MSSIIELFEGPELDAAIAKVVGLPGMVFDGAFRVNLGEYDEWKNPDGEIRTPGGCVLKWSPSTDLAVAFEAAEKVGLFSPGNNVTLWKIGPGYRIALDVPNGFGVTRESLPMAICAAIIRLSERMIPTVITATDVPTSMIAEVELPGMKRAEFVTVHHDNH